MKIDLNRGDFTKVTIEDDGSFTMILTDDARIRFTAALIEAGVGVNGPVTVVRFNPGKPDPDGREEPTSPGKLIDVDAAWASVVSRRDGTWRAPVGVSGIEQQKSHATLSDAVLAVAEKQRPYRDAYRHAKCGEVTVMGSAIARTYQAKPDAYAATYCLKCKGYFPVGPEGEFTWVEMSGLDGPKVGT